MLGEKEPLFRVLILTLVLILELSTSLWAICEVRVWALVYRLPLEASVSPGVTMGIEGKTE